MSGRFSAGQACVALSRVKTLEGLLITNFDSSKIMHNPSIPRALATMSNLQPHLTVSSNGINTHDTHTFLLGHLNVRGYIPHSKYITHHALIQTLD